MTKRKYGKMCKNLFAKANEIGVKLDFEPNDFHHDRLNCLWSGGWYATVEVTPQICISIGIHGDVCATLFDKNDNEIAYVKDKNNSGAFSRYMFPYIKNDKALQKRLNNGQLILDNNNWIEHGGIYYRNQGDEHGIEIDLGVFTDNILDNNILEALSQVLDSIPEITKEITDCLPSEAKGVKAA